EYGRVRTQRRQRRRQDLVVVAHRGPVRYATRATPDGPQRVMERNNGGLVTALRDVPRYAAGTRFLCAASTDEDRRVAANGWQPVTVGGAHCLLRMLDIDPELRHDFYAVVANPMLWFLQHGLWDLRSAPGLSARELDAWDHGYTAVNRQFADALIRRDDTA